MINIPIAEELTDEEDSVELEVVADQKHSGKYRFKKSDMKSLLIGGTDQTCTAARRDSCPSTSTSWLKSSCFSAPSISRRNAATWSCSKVTSQET